MSFPARKIRTFRSNSRGTLHPTVRDFSEQVIGNYTGDDDLHISTIQRAQSEASFYANRPAPFKNSSVTYNNVDSIAQSHIPATFDTPRSSTINPEEVHRRHVVRSARLRSRLSGKKPIGRQESRQIIVPNGWSPDPEPGFYPSYPSGSGYTSRSPRSPRPERPVSAFIGRQMARPRTATTGRYFDISNGLCKAAPSHYGYGQHSQRASAWVGPGMMIQKMRLNLKDAVWRRT